MKHILFACLVFVLFFTSSQRIYAQCDGQRYYNLIFGGYDTSTVVYSNNGMTMDIYQPDGDTATQRRAILMIHGGNFYEGTSKDPFIYYICQRFVQRGYVVASINYSEITPAQVLQQVLLDSTTAYPIIAQTISDGRAAVRYLKAQAASLGIDSSWIVIGGESSGALIADNIAYIKTLNGLSPTLDSAFLALGGLEGNGGNNGYTSKVKAVLNFGGGMLDLNSLTNLDNEPILTAQGDSDHTIPYECAPPFDYYPDYQVCGGGAMQPVLNNLGIVNVMEHYDSLDSEPWNDTILSGPLQGRVILSMLEPQVAVFLYQIECPTFNGVKDINTIHIALYPNPASSSIYVQTDQAIESIDIIDDMGRLLRTVNVDGEKAQVDISPFSSGIYIAKVNLLNKGSAVRTFVVE